ncbi:hypothetical protein EW026_g6930 [Hermanssonia centrifuga]|uniref:Uncharacterized protein n=1 Tax=Hermanssonia centrifuga TaxID=98765 RepID=A0A4S4KB66_9APHY|nr:hypothetical protein EW026_g6930 [Hermanssonia centrifuga]
MAKTAQKKKQTVASPPYVSTQAKNTNAHPGLVDISKDSDPERANHNSKRKAARSKGEIAKQYAQEVLQCKYCVAQVVNKSYINFEIDSS